MKKKNSIRNCRVGLERRKKEKKKKKIEGRDRSEKERGEVR